jgi:hypothetical protein
LIEPDLLADPDALRALVRQANRTTASHHATPCNFRRGRNKKNFPAYFCLQKVSRDTV